MSKSLKAFFLACCLVVLRPALADYSQLQASTSETSGQVVTVAIHNPTASPVTARVRVVVQVDDDNFYSLTSAKFTVAAGATASVSVSAPAPVVAIIDDPEPIGSIQVN